MAVFRVQVFYSRGVTGKWTNVWHVDGASIPDVANSFSATAVPDLLPLLDSSCQLVRYLVSDLAGVQFDSVDINEAGTSTASGDMLPLFNSVKVLLNDGQLGRPDLKYLKGLVTESVQTGGELNATFVSAVDVLVTTLLSDMSANATPLCSEDGNEYVTASVQPAVQMRQMHRKRKRTVAP